MDHGISICSEREKRITALENALLRIAFASQDDYICGHDVFNAIKKSGIKFSKLRLEDIKDGVDLK